MNERERNVIGPRLRRGFPCHGNAVSNKPACCRRTRTRGGWMLVEAVVTVALLGMVAAALSVTQAEAGRFNAIQLMRQRCIAAASAQLDSVAATAQELPPAEVSRLWPGVKTQVSRAAGQGQWQGLTLVTAKAVGDARGHVVSIELARYVKSR